MRLRATSKDPDEEHEKVHFQGGTGVVTGSPPNLVVLSNLNKQFGDNKAPLSYATWMGFAIPLMLFNTLASWLWICLLQAGASRNSSSKTLYKKTVQHNVDDDILTKQCFPRALR
jgi:hypothetical protein